MKQSDFIEMMERIASKELALEYDNVGLLIGTEREIRRVLVALDCTLSVANEAEKLDVDLVLTHHPVFFHGVKRILPDDPETAAAYRLIRSGIGLYAAHTNLDACLGGVNDALAEALELSELRPFPFSTIGRIGKTQKPIPFADFLSLCNERLNTSSRFYGNPDRMVQTVGVVGGAGGDLAEEAFFAGCDVFVTGEMKHHEALAATFRDLLCIVPGHYETESVVLKKWISRLQDEENDVQYYETTTERSPLIARQEEKA